MKARSVYETLEFERGQDPRISLNIGKRKNMIDLFQKIIKDDTNPVDKIGWSRDKGFTKFNGEIPKGIKDYLHFEGIGSSFKSGVKKVVKEYGLQNYLIMPGGVSMNYSDKKAISFPIKKGSEHIFKGLYVDWRGNIHTDMDIWKIMGESINFERGKDPKSAMGIGIEARLNDEDELEDIIEEMDQELGSSMEIFLPLDKKKEIARMWLYKRHEFKVLDQEEGNEENEGDEGWYEYEPESREFKYSKPKTNYELEALEKKGWEVFYEENNFGTIQIILTRKI